MPGARSYCVEVPALSFPDQGAWPWYLDMARFLQSVGEGIEVASLQRYLVRALCALGQKAYVAEEIAATASVPILSVGVSTGSVVLPDTMGGFLNSDLFTSVGTYQVVYGRDSSGAFLAPLSTGGTWDPAPKFFITALFFPMGEKFFRNRGIPC